jgi:uncharacterized protein (DUF1800 family)
VDRTLRALNRFGLGARVAERDTITDPRAWLRVQLEGGPPLLRAPEVASPSAIGDAVRTFRMLGRASQQERQQARRRLVAIGAAEARAALTARATSDRPFVERLVAFWSNHLCVSVAAKVLVAPLAGSYEREAIRPHVLGRFEDMVLASARHPAMLFYLDNAQSIGPNSRGVKSGRRAGAQRGLNENYARELLELHTLGVNGGYTQRDVQELAKVLTGWTVEGFARPRTAGPRRVRGRMPAQSEPDGPITFGYEDLLHEPGSKTVLDRRYNGGVGEGEEAIKALCGHPSTARFIATKLAAHFISDAPPDAAVARLERAFRESNGDLKVVAITLIDVPEAWAGDARKFRTPQEWTIAVLRAFNAAEASERIAPVLRQLRHPLWSPQAPKGFGDTMPEWADSDALMNRAELARTLARQLRDRPVEPRQLLTVVDVQDDDPLRKLLADTSIPAGERIALAIAGPAFQWR